MFILGQYYVDIQVAIEENSMSVFLKKTTRSLYIQLVSFFKTLNFCEFSSFALKWSSANFALLQQHIKCNDVKTELLGAQEVKHLIQSCEGLTPQRFQRFHHAALRLRLQQLMVKINNSLIALQNRYIYKIVFLFHNMFAIW